MSLTEPQRLALVALGETSAERGWAEPAQVAAAIWPRGPRGRNDGANAARLLWRLWGLGLAGPEEFGLWALTARGREALDARRDS